MKRFLRDYVPLAFLASVIVILDQLSKSWIRTNLAPGEVWAPWEWLAPYARLVYWHNTGVAFGMFQGMGQFFSILAIVVAAAILYFYHRVPESDWVLRLALGLQLGGAVGNLIDRLTLGHVIDFVSVGNFAVFNVADASISVGVAVMLLGVWLEERKRPKIIDTPVETTQVSDTSDKGAANL